MNQKLQIRYLPTPEALAQTAAVELLGVLMRRNDLSAPFGISLSGGRIARPFYEAIVAGAIPPEGRAVPRSGQVKQQFIPPASSKGAELFEEVHFFWADERCVPPHDPENSYSIARKHLLEPLAIPAGNIHRIRGEVDHQYAIDEAEAELCRIMPLNEAGQPVLDVVILGMGEDGHVASLFPEEGPDWVSDGKVYRKVTATKPPPDRITLGYQPIFAAREVWVLASGIGKLSAWRALVAGDERLPIARVAAGREKTLVFQDIEKPEE